MNIVLKTIRNAVLIAVGTVTFVVGIAGLILPLVPGTLFLLISAACFSTVLND